MHHGPPNTAQSGSDNDATEDDEPRNVSLRRAPSSPPPSAASSSSYPTSAPHTPNGSYATTSLWDIVDADVPHATVMFSTDGVMIRYVVRFQNRYGVRWCVERRYSDLLALHEGLREAYESTRSLGTKIASFISSGSPSSVARSPLPSASSNGGDVSPSPTASAPPPPTILDDNANSRIIFPKFPSKALGKGTNQSIHFVMVRRRDLSHYFTELVRNNCRTFIRTREAQKTFYDFVRPPPLVRGPGGGVTIGTSIPGLIGAATFHMNAAGNESAYYFREDDNGFLSIEEKVYTYAYFTVGDWSKQKRGRDSASSLASSHQSDRRRSSPRTRGAHKRPVPSPRSAGVCNDTEDDAALSIPQRSAWLKVCMTRCPDQTNSHVNGANRIGTDEADQPSYAPPSLGQRSCRPTRLDRNGCACALIPTITVCLPYARILHDLYDSRRVVVALRCEKTEGRAEVIRRRDELVAFYRHIANGVADRLPDVHEAKRFFVNFRRDNPLQDYGGPATRLSSSARTRDRLPSSMSSGSSAVNSQQRLAKARRQQQQQQRVGGNVSDTEDTVDRAFDYTAPNTNDGYLDETDENEDAMHGSKSLVVSLASLRFSAAGGSPTSLSAPGFPSDCNALAACDDSLPCSPNSAGAATVSTDHLPSSSVVGPIKDGEKALCQNSSHFVGYVVTDSQGVEVDSHTKVLRDCNCSDRSFCIHSDHASSSTLGGSISAATSHDAPPIVEVAAATFSTPPPHTKKRFTGYESASGFKIRVFPPLSGGHRSASPQRSLGCTAGSERSATPPGGVSRKTHQSGRR